VRALDVALFAASVDDAATNRKFAESIEADYPILSDPEKKVAEAYGVLGPFGVARRWTFYIGPDGRILHIDKEVKTATAGDDVVARLDALKVKKR
jgi:thioredoxin-dependent peroxiredoxin